MRDKKALAFYFTVNTVMALILWKLDTMILWIIGYVGFGMFLPLAAASWISLAVCGMWAAKGKPKPNVFVIYSGVTGSFFLAALSFGIIYFSFDSGRSGEEMGYGVITLFFITPVLFMECLVSTICAVTRKKQDQTPYNYSAYVNPQLDVQGGMPYGNQPDYQGYPYQNYQGGQPYQPNDPNYPSNNGYYPNGNYPNDNNNYYGQ